MALDTITDKTQQAPPANSDGGSLYDQIMEPPPGAAVAAPPDSTTVKAQDAPPAPGAAPAATQDRSAAPATDQVVAPPGASVVDTTVPQADAAVPAGDKPVPPDQVIAPSTADQVVPPGAAVAPGQEVAPGAVPPGDAVVVAPPVEGVEDKGNCDFKPDYEYKTEQARAWKSSSDQLRGAPIELNQNGRYEVKFGDSLGVIAQRNLKSLGLSADPQSIKAEVAGIVNANKHRYPSLDCNTDFVKTGWTLSLPQHRPGEQTPPPRQPELPAERPPAEPPRAERLPVERPPAERPPVVEVIPPPSRTTHTHDRAYEGSGNVNIRYAENVKVIYGDSPRAVPSSEPYYRQDQPVYADRRPVYREPVYREPVYREPVYREPVYREPVYREPVYREPVYRDDRRVYRGGGDDCPTDRNRGRSPIRIDGNWGRQQQPWNDDCFGTGRNTRYPDQRDYGYNSRDNGWGRPNPRIAIDFGFDNRRQGRSMPNYDGGRSGPYYGGNNRGYNNRGDGLSIRFRL
ncbi:MAG: hypothetical protein SGJ27_10295 [Candidatus Melainabacteria bacterium]|nr:hypothetical protein [Candidatus Melainabacteria bacterium]